MKILSENWYKEFKTELELMVEKKITIVSSFISEGLILELCSNHKDKTIKLITDRINSRYELYKLLKKGKPENLKINTIAIDNENNKGMMHSKLYMIDERVAFVGSANFTNSGTQLNEEFMIKLVPNSELTNYLSKLQSISTSISEVKELEFKEVYSSFNAFVDSGKILLTHDIYDTLSIYEEAGETPNQLLLDSITNFDVKEAKKYGYSKTLSKKTKICISIIDMLNLGEKRDFNNRPTYDQLSINKNCHYVPYNHLIQENTYGEIFEINLYHHYSVSISTLKSMLDQVLNKKGDYYNNFLKGISYWKTKGYLKNPENVELNILYKIKKEYEVLNSNSNDYFKLINPVKSNIEYELLKRTMTRKLHYCNRRSKIIDELYKLNKNGII